MTQCNEENPKLSPYLIGSELSDWEKLQWEPFANDEPSQRVTKWGGQPTPIWGANKCITDWTGELVYFFFVQIVLPDGRLAQVYTDPDAIHNGDFGNYEEAYEQYGETPYYQSNPPTESDEIFDFVLIEGEPLPPKYRVNDGEQEIISEQAYVPLGVLPVEPSWLAYKDNIDGGYNFLAQFPCQFSESMPDWEQPVMYVWIRGTEGRVTWQSMSTAEEFLDVFDRETQMRIKKYLETHSNGN